MQGFNMGRYVPPDQEGLVSANSLHKKRPPGMRASGEQVVRFEMPFAVWCEHCPKPTLIPQGVRFNAVKTKVGNYYSTPIWAFRIKHVECGGTLVIRTDPKNTAYVVADGGRKRDMGPEDEGGRPSLKDQDREDARQSAFSKLEKTIEDREALAAASERIDWLQEDREQEWKDPYAMNQTLRKQFRVGRHARENEAMENGELRDRLGGISEGLNILPETEEDRRRTALVEFGKGKADEQGTAIERPLFEKRDKSGKEAPVKLTKAEALAKRTREDLAAKVAGSVRKEKDPFLTGNSLKAPPKPPILLALKRKRDTGSNDADVLFKERKIEENLPVTTEELNQPAESTKKIGLVDYSDSE
ncbi:hypothetical protein MKZ38_005444 [Zalerion maritima]|uniref:Uncharacterized protein n=1 Tax=Zalerion maritima TaxID=339359 RepID=A0AAD5WPA0_9PEZI|nr:hypothetical protein MKZ38_005444 [Zalerion maritima]